MHSLLNATLGNAEDDQCAPPQSKLVRVFTGDGVEQIIHQILASFEAGLAIDNLTDHFFATIVCYYHYRNSLDLMLQSSFGQYLVANGYEFSGLELHNRGESLLQHLKELGMPEDQLKVLGDLPSPTPLGLRPAAFLVYLSLFLPKLVTGTVACIKKVKRTYQQLESQGINIIPRGWMTPVMMNLTYRALRLCFFIRFSIIHHVLHQRAGIDAVDTIMAGAVEQTRFAGLLMVRNILTYIITKGNEKDKYHIHPLAQDKRMREEVTRFEYCIKNIQRHGIYAPFARVLGLAGVSQIEHGQFPRLTAIALGVSSVYQSTLLGVNMDMRYQSLKEAAHQAELELQAIQCKKIRQDTDLDDDERVVLLKFAERSQSINKEQWHQEGLARQEPLQKLTEREAGTSSQGAGPTEPSVARSGLPGDRESISNTERLDSEKGQPRATSPQLHHTPELTSAEPAVASEPKNQPKSRLPGNTSPESCAEELVFNVDATLPSDIASGDSSEEEPPQSDQLSDSQADFSTAGPDLLAIPEGLEPDQPVLPTRDSKEVLPGEAPAVFPGH